MFLLTLLLLTLFGFMYTREVPLVLDAVVG